MKKKSKFILVGYNMLLAMCAIIAGVLMIREKMIFSTYPNEWLTKIPFNNWFSIGIIAILIFGVGNIIASVLSLRESIGMSIVMSVLLIVSLFIQRVMLGEWYLPTIEMLIVAVIQLGISFYMVYNKRRIEFKLIG